MSDKTWEELVDLLDVRYTIDNHTRREEPLEDQPSLKRRVETLELEKDNQKYRVERISQPAVSDVKTHYARSGVASRVEKSYDKDEWTHNVAFYRQTPSGHWNEIQAEDFLS